MMLSVSMQTALVCGLVYVFFFIVIFVCGRAALCYAARLFSVMFYFTNTFIVLPLPRRTMFKPFCTPVVRRPLMS